MTILDEPDITHLDFEPTPTQPRRCGRSPVGGTELVGLFADYDWSDWDESWQQKVDARMAKIIPAADVLPNPEPDESLQTFWQSVEGARRPFGYPDEVLSMSPVMSAVLKAINDRMAADPETNWVLSFVMCSPSRHQLLGGRNGNMYTYQPEAYA